MIASARSDLYLVDDIQVTVDENKHSQARVTLQDSKAGLIIIPASLVDELYAAICRAREDFKTRREAICSTP